MVASGMERVGFIGLGVMGRPMARNLQVAGHQLVVHTRTQQTAATVLSGGAEWAATPADVAGKVDTVITMLPDSPDVRLAASGKDGLLEGGHSGLMWIDMSTISPDVARELAALARNRGMSALDAPVSGGEVGAIGATLSIMVGGPVDAFERALPILNHLGNRIIHMGEAGAGQITKVCNQIVVGTTIGSIAEALVLGAKAGVDPNKIREALLGGFAQSRILELHGERMLKRNFEPGFRCRLEQKDLAIVVQFAKSQNAPVPLTSLVAQLWNATCADGGSELDYSALVLTFERLAGVTLSEATWDNASSHALKRGA